METEKTFALSTEDSEGYWPSIHHTFKDISKIFREKLTAILLRGGKEEDVKGINCVLASGGRAVMQEVMGCDEGAFRITLNYPSSDLFLTLDKIIELLHNIHISQKYSPDLSDRPFNHLGLPLAGSALQSYDYLRKIDKIQ